MGRISLRKRHTHFMGAMGACSLIAITIMAACGGSNLTYTPGTASVKSTTTLLDPSGRPVASVTREAASSGPGASGSADAIKSDFNATAPITSLADVGNASGGDTSFTFSGKSVSTFGPYALGALCLLAGLLCILKFNQLAAGTALVLTGSLVIAGTAYPFLYLAAGLVGLMGAIYLGYRQWGMTDALRSTVNAVDRLKQTAPLAATQFKSEIKSQLEPHGQSTLNSIIESERV